jgi:hypothetical protein
MREGKGDKQCLTNSLKFTFILSFFPFSMYNPPQDKRKYMNLWWISKASCPNVERIKKRNENDTNEL